jgi:hypothetical protein
MAKTATKKTDQTTIVASRKVDWPPSINLQERLPVGHKRAGDLRYARTNGGVGRMDMDNYQDVPQHLVDAALAAEAAEAAASEQQSKVA